MKHPNFDFIRDLVDDILKDNRRLSEWELEDVDYDFLSHAYHAVFISRDGQLGYGRFLTEWFDSVETMPAPFPRRKIKTQLRRTLLKQAEEEMEESS